MSLTLTAAVSGLVEDRVVHRQAEVWRISPARGSVASILITGHNRPLTFDMDGLFVYQTYTPAGGFDATAAQAQSGLREVNRDILGVFTDDRFTEDDLRAGVWDNALVEWALVDWLYPHAGAIEKRKYRIGRIKHTGEQFTAELSGVTNRLHARSGRIITRPCNADLFDDRCGLSITADVSTGSRYESNNVNIQPGTQDADEPRRKFDMVLADLPNAIDTGFFDYGEIHWTVGENARAGVISIIKAYVESGSERKFELYEPTPFDIDDADQGRVLVGCDKLFATCRDKFDPLATGEGNTLNFRGKHLMPGSDHVLRTPNVEG